VANSLESSSNKEPEAETLNVKTDDKEVVNKTDSSKVSHAEIDPKEKKRQLKTFRPSHKATFMGLGAVIIILAINATVLAVLLKSETAKTKKLENQGVSISPADLAKLGVNNSKIGNASERLTVDPNAQFNSNLAVGGNVQIGGQLHLNSTFSASSANLTQLQAGNTSVTGLNVNGNATASNLSLRGKIGVAGAAVFQNTVNIGQILTVENSAAVANNLSVGGEITANTIATNNLILSGSFVFGSHIQTSGLSPSVIPGGGALGDNGTVSINGDDATGTIDINIGANAHDGGILAQVTFHNSYTAQPRIVITPIGIGANFYIVSPSTSGFSVAVTSALPPGGYALDYIVEQ